MRRCRAVRVAKGYPDQTLSCPQLITGNATKGFHPYYHAVVLTHDLLLITRTVPPVRPDQVTIRTPPRMQPCYRRRLSAHVRTSCQPVFFRTRPNASVISRQGFRAYSPALPLSQSDTACHSPHHPIALRFRVLGEIPTLANTVDVSRRRPSSACIDFHTFRVAPISTPRDSKASGVLAN